MIRPPHRSVTRFFIPLIDVLILLFCIFLLMPYVKPVEGEAAEWFPLLGLIGTVAAILQTFGSITPGVNPTPQEIIRKYAPAITATGSGLFMALLNILPTWVVATGRDLILTLGGGRE